MAEIYTIVICVIDVPVRLQTNLNFFSLILR